MMNKGQISFDVIFALIMILMLASVLASVSTGIAENQHRVSIKAQEKQIALDVARILKYSKMMYTGGTSSFEYEIPFIQIGGYGAPIGCDIQVETVVADSEGKITVSVNDTHYGELEATDPAIEVAITTIDFDLGALPITFNCGATETFSNP